MTISAADPLLRNGAHPGNRPAEHQGQSFRALLGRLPWHSSDHPPLQTLGFTSCSSGEGVSTVAIRLAMEAARNASAPVLLVDANLACPVVHKVLGVKPGPGLAEALREGIPLLDAIQLSGVAGLSVLSAGQAGADLLSVYDAPGLTRLLDLLKEEFALVVLDLPPTQQHATAALAGLLDGVVLVVEAERTRLERVRHEKERLERQAHLLGVVLNKLREYTPEWLNRLL
jgi:Mrp family chromosome partitioning ATPase